MILEHNDNHDDDLQDYIAADDEGDASTTSIIAVGASSAETNDLVGVDNPYKGLGVNPASAVDNSNRVAKTLEARHLDDGRLQNTGIPILAPAVKDKCDALEHVDAAPEHKDGADSDHYVLEGGQDDDATNVRDRRTAELDEITAVADYPILSSSSPGRFTHHHQLQSMADLLHRHQLEQARQDVAQGTKGDIAQDLATPLQTQPGERSSATTVHVETAGYPGRGTHPIGAASSGLKDVAQTVDDPPQVLAQLAPAFIPPPLRPPPTVLGKRKAYSEVVGETSSSVTESRQLDKEIDECLGSLGSLTPTGKKKRRSRARKPQALPPSKVVGQPPVQPPAVTVEVSPAPEPQIFKHEAQRRWRRIDPYVAMMKVIMKERLKDGWAVMMNSIAEVTADGEEKDIRRVKQTWANEFTRLKSQAEKGRLVTLADLNCSWPWNLAEKKILWMTGVALCSNKVTWAVVAAEASRIAKNCGEPPVTEEECKAEWDNVLKHEYLDEPTPDNAGLSASIGHNSNVKDNSVQPHSSDTITLESAPLNTQGSSIRAVRHSKATRSRIARINDRYERGDSSDFLHANHADESLLRLLEEGPIGERPLNQPLQVQPPRETTVAIARKDPVTSHTTTTGGGATENRGKGADSELAKNDKAHDEPVDQVSDADEGEYVILGEDDVEEVTR